MPGQDDPHRGPHGDPFDFREPPAPLGGASTPDPGPAPAHSPFDFPATAGGPRRRGRLRRRLRAWGTELRDARFSSPGAVVVVTAVLVVLALVVAAVVALL